MKIRLGHSPDADDAFMFYALAAGKVDTGGFSFELLAEGMPKLNDRASRGELEASVISVHAYAYVRDRYVLSPAGASFGQGYGPRIVSREAMDCEQLKDASVGIPGTTTSAYLTLQLCLPGLRTKLIPFDKIVPAVEAGVVDCGLIIHEGELRHARCGLSCVVDLGEWWLRKTDGLAVPLGCVALREDLPAEARARLVGVIRSSIEYALAHRAEALEFAMRYARDMDERQADEFVGMYVNELTVDMSERGRRAIEEFLRKGHTAGIVPDAQPLRFA